MAVLIRRDESNLCTILDRSLTMQELRRALEQIKKELEGLGKKPFYMDEATKVMLLVPEEDDELTVFMAYYKVVPANKQTFFYR